MAGFGENDRYRTMFESSNRLRFVVEISEDDKAWWLNSIYDPFRLTQKKSEIAFPPRGPGTS